jgi:pimeloyl-ACP methyl ester carboxylesterase
VAASGAEPPFIPPPPGAGASLSGTVRAAAGGRVPLLFVHGFWANDAVWDPLLELYRAAGHDARAVRLPLHDSRLTERPPHALGQLGLADYTAVVLEAVDAMPAPPVLVGHSAGGLLSLLAAARRPVAGLALLAPAAPASVFGVSLGALRTLRSTALRWRWWAEPVALEPGAIRYGVLNEVPDEEALQATTGLVWESGKALFQAALPWFDGSFSSAVDLGRLGVPVLLVVGERDRLTRPETVRRIARRLTSRVDYRELLNTGHWLFHADARARVVHYLDMFVAEVEGDGFRVPA